MSELALLRGPKTIAEDLPDRLGIGCYRGSDEDVLDRVLRAAGQAQADVIVEMTGDCPLIDPHTVEHAIGAFLKADVDYCSTGLEHTYPAGMDTQVFPLSVLEEVARLTDDPIDREHVSLYINEHPERFRLLVVTSGLPPEAAKFRLTVDTPEDLRLVELIYDELCPDNPQFTLADILDLLRRRPDLPRINRHIRRKPVR